jgi:tRNA 2-thiouridine synthesizing protein E
MRTRPDIIETMDVGGHAIHLDEHGFLVDPQEWNEGVAEAIAAKLGVFMTADHWDVIRFMRDFLAEHGVAADARFVFRFLDERAAPLGITGRDLLFRLFPYGYVGQACKIAGMRQPRAWSTG